MQRILRIPGNLRATGVGLAIVVAAVTLAGCGSETKSSSSESPKSFSKKTARKKQYPVKPKSKKADGQSPHAAALAVFHGLRDNRPVAVWTFLPPSYQKDVNEVVRLFATRMDAELWSRTFAVGRRIIKLARNRKSQILTPEFVKQAGGTDAKSLAKRYDGTIVLIQILLDSEFSDLERLKKFDGGRFLSETGGKLIAQLLTLSRLLPGDDLREALAELDQVVAKTASLDGDSAVVALSLKNLPEADPKNLPFVNIEGQWIPQGLADGWTRNYTLFRQDLEAKLAPEVLQQNKTKMLKILAEVDVSLNQLEAAKSPAEFQEQFAKSPVHGVLLGMIRMTSAPSDGTPAIPPTIGKKIPPKGQPRPVTVIVQGELDAQTAETVADKLFDLGPTLDIGDYSLKNGTTRFPVSAVRDFAAFQKAIQFADVVSADVEKREIVLKLRKP